jgi:hypothetical protein
MAIVLAATAVVKIFIWHDPSLLGGALVALLAARAWKRAAPRPAARSRGRGLVIASAQRGTLSACWRGHS